MSRILHFTLGPVQGFIADARRTRDFWAGSFLLSRLAAEATSVILGSGGRSPAGRIVFPEVDGGGGVDRDPLLLAVRTDGKEGANPFIGSVPNRFKAEITDSDFDPSTCAEAIRRRWRLIADAVWERFVEHAVDEANHGRDGVREIWERQVDHFWEITWVVGPCDAADDGAWLERRKNWRSHFPAGREAGDHCQLMGSYQELSGWVRASGERPRQQAFWQRIRERTGPYNLRPDERLCAIALIKRLFPALKAPKLREVIGWVPASDPRVARNWPSVSYVAAVPWLEASWKMLPGECAQYDGIVRDKTKEWLMVDDMESGIYGETATRLVGVSDEHPFLKLDGNFYFADAIAAMEKEAFAPERFATDGQEPKRREQTLAELAKLHHDLDVAVRARSKNAMRLPPAHASEFYAVLIADGDSIGKNLSEKDGEELARRGLAAFTVGIAGESESVGDIVRRHHGVTVYAGGDDVLALLPLDSAIEAAVALRNSYRQAFPSADKWTMSAAVVFAQYHIPLRAVLAEAHRQLDAVAKEENGRDSLALSVFKPGGVAFEWVSTWDNGKSDSTRVEPPHLLNEFSRDLQASREFTTGFFYNLRERYKPLFEGDGIEPRGSVEALMRKILITEFNESGGQGDPLAQVERVMKIAFPFRRDENGRVQPAKSFSFDAALIARFLAEEGRWFMTRAAASPKTIAVAS
jgi:CRISPR-associated protein Cmr2